MPNYKNSKIYELTSTNENEIKLTYYGSTTLKYLSSRLATHLQNCNINSACSSKKVLIYPNYKINLVELYPCNSKDELNARLQFYIKNNDCVNKNNDCVNKNNDCVNKNNDCVNKNNYPHTESNSQSIQEPIYQPIEQLTESNSQSIQEPIYQPIEQLTECFDLSIFNDEIQSQLQFLKKTSSNTYFEEVYNFSKCNQSYLK